MKKLLLPLILGWLSVNGAKAQPSVEATHNEPRTTRVNEALIDGADKGVEATHNDLRAMRDGLMDAINKGDLDRELSYLTTNVVITWHDARVSRGRQGVREYYDRMVNGPNKIVADFHAAVNVDELTILYGDITGIAFGSSVEHFKLVNGKSFDLNGRWTATMIKENGKWLIASLHVSTDMFDNVILDTVKGFAVRLAVVAFVIALVVGIAMGWLGARAKKLPPPRPTPAKA